MTFLSIFQTSASSLSPDQINIVIVAYSLFILFTLTVALTAFRHAMKQEMSKQFEIASGVFLIGLAFQRIFFVLHDFYLEGDWVSISNRGAGFSIFISFAALCFIIEKKFIHTNYLFTILGIIGAIIQIIAPADFADLVQKYGSPPLMALPFLIYFKVAFQTTGELRRQAISIILGGMLLAFSTIGLSLLNDAGVISFFTCQVLRAILNSVAIYFIWIKSLRVQQYSSEDVQ